MISYILSLPVRLQSTFIEDFNSESIVRLDNFPYTIAIKFNKDRELRFS